MFSPILLNFIASEPIRLELDATEAARGVYRVVETLPAVPSVSYPKFLPGEHTAAGRIADITALHFFANGQEVEWERDPIDQFTLRLKTPKGAKNLTIRFNVQQNPAAREIAFIKWVSSIWLPTGKDIYHMPVRAGLRIPSGWKLASTQPTTLTNGQFSFPEMSVGELADSPVMAAAHLKSYSLGDISGAPVSLQLSADSDQGVMLPDSTVEGVRKLVQQAALLFGGRHFRRYTFYYAGSDYQDFGGLEHHECSENGLAAPKYALPYKIGYILGHEFTHSWNGKYRRPVGLAAANFSQPYDDRLLWVYEGLTEYLGIVLASRSGLMSRSQSLDGIASYIQQMLSTSGRTWRPLVDTATGLDAFNHGKDNWFADSRGGDYYEGGALVWMEADSIIRNGTRGAKSLDDFLKLFVGGVGGPEIKPYELKTVLALLGNVYPYDWAKFFTDRVYRPTPQMPLGFLADLGYRTVMNDEVSTFMWGGLDGPAAVNRWGAFVDDTGKVIDVALDSPAYKGGLGPQMKVKTVNGEAYSRAKLEALLSAPGEHSVVLDVENAGATETLTIKFSGGPLRMHLERLPGTKDVLSQILTAR